MVDTNRFAKHFVEIENIASIDDNFFKFNSIQGIWQIISPNGLKKLIINRLEEELPIVKNDVKNNVFEFIKAHAENNEMKKILNERNFNNNQACNEISLKDGIYNVSTDELIPYQKEHYKLAKLEYTLEQLMSDKQPVLWLNFLTEITRGWKNQGCIIQFLQEYIGYCLIENVKFEKALLLHGLGANGKGVFVNVIKALLGSDNAIGIGLHEINKDQNLGLLIGKLLLVDSDMQQNVQLDSGIIKKIISGEPIIGKLVYQNPITFSPHTKLIICTNEMPYLKSGDHSIRRRFVIIHLKKSFIEKPNPNLKNELLTEKDLILGRALQGLRNLLARGYFDICPELETEINEFIKNNDSVELFLEESSIQKGEDFFICNQEIYNMYKLYSRDNGLQPLSQRKFNSRLESKGFKKVNKGKCRGFTGLGGSDFGYESDEETVKILETFT